MKHAPSGRCGWSLCLVGGSHDTRELVHWECLEDNPVYDIPPSRTVPKEVDNVVACGRCVNADSHALSAIRVIGPCLAMGTAAAHALDLAGSGAVPEIDLKQFRERLHDNVKRKDQGGSHGVSHEAIRGRAQA